MRYRKLSLSLRVRPIISLFLFLSASLNPASAQSAKQDEWQTQLASYQKLIDQQLSLNKPNDAIETYKQITNLLRQNGQYKLALEYTQTELNQLSKMNNKLQVAYAEEALSEIYYKLDDASKTVSWGKKSLESMLIAKGANSAEYAQGLLNFSRTLKALKEHDEAEKYASQSVLTFKKLPAGDELILALSMLGQIRQEKGDYKNAIASFKEAMQLNEQITKFPERKEMRNIECWKHLAGSCEKAQEWAGAEYFWKKLIEWKIKNGKDPDYYRTMLAFCYGHEGKIKDADETFSEILQQKREENDSAKLGTYLDWYVRYLESTGRSAEADKARRELNLVRAR